VPEAALEALAAVPALNTLRVDSPAVLFPFSTMAGLTY
jgi:hypothetical protein